MDNNDLDWLANWYARGCNNDWEHSYGNKIVAFDNLKETSLEGRPFVAKLGELAGDLDEWRKLARGHGAQAGRNCYGPRG